MIKRGKWKAYRDKNRDLLRAKKKAYELSKQIAKEKSLQLVVKAEEMIDGQKGSSLPGAMT